MAGPTFPSWVYHKTLPGRIVAAQRELDALGTGWSGTPSMGSNLKNQLPGSSQGPVFKTLANGRIVIVPAGV